MISQALGHKHLDTTIKYLDWLDDELIEASNEFYAQPVSYTHLDVYKRQILLTKLWEITWDSSSRP